MSVLALNEKPTGPLAGVRILTKEQIAKLRELGAVQADDVPFIQTL